MRQLLVLYIRVGSRMNTAQRVLRMRRATGGVASACAPTRRLRPSAELQPVRRLRLKRPCNPRLPTTGAKHGWFVVFCQIERSALLWAWRSQLEPFFRLVANARPSVGDAAPTLGRQHHHHPLAGVLFCCNIFCRGIAATVALGCAQGRARARRYGRTRWEVTRSPWRPL